jgi:hypothetical protein
MSSKAKAAAAATAKAIATAKTNASLPSRSGAKNLFEVKTKLVVYSNLIVTVDCKYIRELLD